MLYSICIILRNWSGIMKRFKSSKKLICLICAMALLTGMCSVFAMASGNPAYSSTDYGVAIDIDRTPMYETDVSVMSFNLMHEVSTAETKFHYGSLQSRLDNILKIIEVYDPDIICFQECADRVWDEATKTSTYLYIDGTMSSTAISGKTTMLGYLNRTLVNASDSKYNFNSAARDGVTMFDYNGLAIYFKKDRFTLGDKKTIPYGTGSNNVVSRFKYTHTDKTTSTTVNTVYDFGLNNTSFQAHNRYYQYVELTDSKHNNQTFYVFNTQLSSDPVYAWLYTTNSALTTTGTKKIDELTHTNKNNTISSLSNIREVLGRQMRTEQAKRLKTAVNAFAKNYPTIIAGDFNTGFANTTTATNLPNNYSEIGLRAIYDDDDKDDDLPKDDPGICPSIDAYYPADRMAVHQVDTDYKTALDHIFVNSAMYDIADYRTISESVDGRRASDHFPVLTQLSYRVPVTITSSTGTGHYDFTNGAYTDTVQNNSYTFEIDINDLNDDTQDGTEFTYVIKQKTPSNPEGAALTANGGKTATLSNTINKFDIEFYVKTSAKSTATLYDTIPATIRYTGADKPILQTENVLNHYFANNAYQIVVANDVQDIIVRPINGQLYSDEACTKRITGRFYNVQPGRNTYYIKAVGTKDGKGDIYPVYICKEDQLALKDPMVLYIDDDFGDAVGPVAFWDGTEGGGISLVEMGKKGFAHFDDIEDTVNQKIDDRPDGYTVYVAPGNYKYLDATNNYDQTVNRTHYKRNLTILGPNHDIEANYRDMEGTWQLNDKNRDIADGDNTKKRVEEAVIDGMIRFQPNDTDLTTAKITIKGFKFEGKTTNASIQITDNRGQTFTGDTTNANKEKSIYLATNGYKVEMDIQNNIFSASGYHFNAAAVSANTGAIKTGVIANNYFKSRAARVVNDKGNSANQDPVNDYYRAIFLRNPKGLLIDGNRFVDITVPIWMASEVHDGVSNLTFSNIGGNVGNLSYTMQDNRFENCGSAYIWATALGEKSEANIKYINNGFIRCGSETEGPAIDINLTEHYYKAVGYQPLSTISNTKAGKYSTAKTDYSKVDITIHGNNFMDCYQSIRIYRISGERWLDRSPIESYLFQMHGDMNDMKLKINQNRFINPTEATEQNEELTKTINFNFFLNPNDATKAASGTERNLVTPTKWNLAYNYFTSNYLTAGTGTDDLQNANTNAVVDTDGKGIHNPKYFVKNYTTIVNPAKHQYQFEGVSFNTNETNGWLARFAPYYLDYALSKLSEGERRTLTATATPVNQVYNGNEHEIVVTPSESDAIISYSLDPNHTATSETSIQIQSLKAYSAHNFKFTDVTNGPITVYYKVEKAGYKPFYGSSTVEITPATHDDLISDRTEFYVYGTEHTLTLNPKSTDIEDHYRFFYNNTEYTEIPKFTNVGRYNIKVIVTNPNYKDKEDDATLVIEQASLEEYANAIKLSYDNATATNAYKSDKDPNVGKVDVEYDPDNASKKYTLLFEKEPPRDVVVEYSVNGGEWTIGKPEYTKPTDEVQNIKVRMGGTPNYLLSEREYSINITPAYIEDVSVTSVEATENGDPLDLLTVNTGRKGTTVKYAVYTDEVKEYTDTKPTFLKPGTYTVSVWFTRPYHHDRVITHNVTVKPKTITNNFDLGFTQSLVQNQTFKDKLEMEYNPGFANQVMPNLKSERYTLTYQLSMWPTTEGEKVFASKAVSIDSFGVYYAATRNDLEDYAFYHKHGFAYETDAKNNIVLTKNAQTATEAMTKMVETDKTIGKYNFTNRVEGGFTALYRYNNYHIYNVQPLKARYAMMFIRYSIDGKTFEELSPIYGTSTLLGDHTGEGNGNHGFVTSDGTGKEISLEEITGAVKTDASGDESTIFLQSSEN